MATAERTRGARDIICSYDLSKGRTRLGLPYQPLWLPKGSPSPNRRRGGIVVCHIIEQIDVVRSWSEFPMRSRVESDKNTRMFAIIETVAARTEISVRSLLSGETGLI
jgi:hypothetical protein